MKPNEQEAAGPSLARLEGPSFTVGIKGLSTLLLLGLTAGAWQTLQMGAWAQWGTDAHVIIVLTTGAILAGYWGIVSGRTSIDGRCLRQSGLWRKEVQLADITQMKLIEVPGLNWLIVPRVVVRSGRPGFTTFQVADPRVLGAVKRLAYG